MLVNRDLRALRLGVDADGAHARRAVTAVSKELVELADGLHVFSVAQRPQRGRILKILSGTEIGVNGLIEKPLFAQQNGVVSLFDGKLCRRHSSCRLAVDDDFGTWRCAVRHYQRIHRRQMKDQRQLTACSNIDRPYFGRIARFARGDDVLSGTETDQTKWCDP